MKKLKLSTLFYMIGVFTFFIFFNNMDLIESKISTPKKDKEIVVSSVVSSMENKNRINDILRNVSNFIILSAFIGLVIILFLKRKSLEEETNQIQEQSLNIEETKREDINYLGRYCVDFNITIEDLQRLTKEKSI